MKSELSQLDVNKLVGKAFEDLTFEEMDQIQGSGTENARSTPIMSAVSAFYTGIQVSNWITGIFH